MGFVEIGHFQPSWVISTLWSADLSEALIFNKLCAVCVNRHSPVSLSLSLSLSAVNSFRNDPALCTEMERPAGDVESSFLYGCIFSLEKNAFITQFRGRGRSG